MPTVIYEITEILPQAKPPRGEKSSFGLRVLYAV
jgi:hypothetical protein